MTRQRRSSELRARLKLYCRTIDLQRSTEGVLQAAQPIEVSGGVGHYQIPLACEWFEPSLELRGFPYTGSFETAQGILWFASDGNDIVSFLGWLPTLDEMKSRQLEGLTGGVDQELLIRFKDYLLVRERAEKAITCEQRRLPRTAGMDHCAQYVAFADNSGQPFSPLSGIAVFRLAPFVNRQDHESEWQPSAG
jgi:hypothetical protein